MLIENHSLLPQLFSEVNNIIQGFAKDKYIPAFIDNMVFIILEIVKAVKDKSTHFIASETLKSILNHPHFSSLVKDNRKMLLQYFS